MGVEVTKLPTGLTVVTDTMPHLETAALGVWAGVGGRDEKPDEHGISHLLEHMAFKGTTTRSAREIVEAIEAVGGDLNAGTSTETTAYYARVLKADVPLALDVLSDILANPSFVPEELEREKNVIVQEIGAAQDTPDDVVFEHLNELCFPDQPMGRSLLGTAKTLQGFDRDKLHALLEGIEGLSIPATIPVSRERLNEVAEEREPIEDVAAALGFPIIVRPRGSHAGVGLEKVDEPIELSLYLDEREEQEFFVSRFIDYASEDGLFRKYRVVFVDGVAYACHMAIARRWDIWYLNAGMAASEAKRLEEAAFMQTFDIGFGRRHRSVLAAIAERIGLDYFIIDCAETKDGSLLVFEADNTAVVHNMDPPDVFPYKPPQMQKIFAAFAAMIAKRAAAAAERAA
ncbi:MAG: insulinase family protein [Bradyrhizobium sp.]|nr:insulinase family protein [Bradyrhizobium sp.]